MNPKRFPQFPSKILSSVLFPIALGVSIATVVPVQSQTSAEMRTPADSAATSYAPVDTLYAQIQATVAELTEKMDALQTGAVSWENSADDVHRLSGAIAVYALVAGLHDQYCPFKDSSTLITENASELAKSTSAENACLTWKNLQKAFTANESKNPAWDVQVTDTRNLMRAIGVYENEIETKIKKRRGLEAVAPQAVGMASLFQGLTANYRESAPENAINQWQEFAMRGRDAAYYLFITLEVGDRKNSPKNLARLQETCASCHQEFKK